MEITVKKLLLELINRGLLFSAGRRVINNIFETGSFRIKDFFKLNVPVPQKDIDWKIRLLNRKWITIDVPENDFRAWDYALSYNWHEPGLSRLEALLNNYYHKKYHYLDIGGNMGLRSLYALSIGRPTVIFEPNPDVAAFAKVVFAKNDFKNYTVENLCISDKESEIVEFYISTSSYLSSLIKSNSEREGVAKVIEANCNTLDNYVFDNLLNPKIIKIDVEGAESNVIKGSLEAIQKFQPTFIIEILKMDKDAEEIFKLFNHNAYRIFGIYSNSQFVLKELEFTADRDYEEVFYNYLFIKDENCIEFLFKKDIISPTTSS